MDSRKKQFDFIIKKYVGKKTRKYLPQPFA